MRPLLRLSRINSTPLLGAAFFVLVIACAPGAGSARSVASSPAVAPERNVLKVVTTTSVFADIVQNIGGSRVAATSIIPPGVGPEDYEPKPDDARKLADAQLIVSNGVGLDDFLDKLLASGTGGQTPHLVLGDGIPVLTVDGEANPHFWLDPTLAKRYYLPAIAAKLTELDPTGKATWSDLAFLTTADGSGLDLRGLLLAAFILGAVGVLDDVTVTQAVLVEELAEKAQLRGTHLFTSGMAIGRSHIAATVNTLFLAYVGAGLPLLVVLVVSAQPGALVFNDELIATEIVRTLVGSLGIVAAVPLTTFIAAALIGEPATGAVDRSGLPGRAPLTAFLAGGVIAALLVLTATLPLTSGRRTALAPDVLDPRAMPSAGSSQIPSASEAIPSGGPLGSPVDEPAIVGANEAVPITLDGQAVGTVTVSSWTVTPADPPATDASISVVARYEATAPFPLTTGSWEVLLADGTEIPLVPADGSDPLTGTLGVGEGLEVTLEGVFSKSDDSPFIAFADREAGTLLFVVPID